MKKIQNGEVSTKIPELTEWDLRLIEFYALCISQDGLNVSYLKIIFESNNIKSNELFYETCLILGRSFNEMRN